MKQVTDAFPLTLIQRDIYFDQLHHEGCSLYNIGGYIRCRDIDEPKLAAAHRQVVSNNDAFGIRIVTDEHFTEGQGVTQTISEQRTLELEVLDFTDCTDPVDAAQNWLRDIFQTPVAFENCELFRSWLVRLGDGEYWYVGFSHHLAMDGVGFANWAKKLALIYNALVADAPVPQDLPQSRWDEVSLSDQSYVDSKKVHKDRDFWLDHCAQLPDSLLSAHYLHQFDNVKNLPSRRHVLHLSRELFGQLEAAASAFEVGVPQVFLGVLACYLSQAYEQQRLAFAILGHNRKNFAQKNTVGVFTSASPILVDVSGQADFATLVRTVAAQQRNNLRHQRFPLGDLLQGLGRRGGGERIYDVVFNYLKLDYTDLNFGGINAEVAYVSHEHDQTPLSVTVWDGDSDTIEVQLDYNLAYFNQPEVELLANRLAYLLDNVASGRLMREGLPLAQLSGFGPDEVAQILRLAQGELQPQWPTHSLSGLFEARVQWAVAQGVTHPALTCGQQSLSYQRLDEQANQLAHCLIAKGIGHGDLVAICIERSVSMMLGLLAILKTGAAYLPLDPGYPPARLQYMLEDSGTTLVLSAKHIAAQPWLQQTATLLIDNFADFGSFSTLSPVLQRPIAPSDLVYVIYTSGTSGLPKGVEISHGNVANFLLSVQKVPGCSVDDRLLAVTPISFDIHVLELYLPLISGAHLVLSEQNDNLDGIKLASLVQSHEITLMQATPATWKLLLATKSWAQATDSTAHLTVLCGGEAIGEQLAGALKRKCKALWNMYGPTETTVWSSCVNLSEVEGTVTIGRPLANSGFYVLNQHRQLQGIGLYGELAIGGAGLAKGYLNQAQMTADKFVDVVLDNGPSERVYRTGDLVRCLPCGQFEIAGRLDEQVKIRGFRIELPEIEFQLSVLPQVAQVLVVAQQSPDELDYLVAYIEWQTTVEGLPVDDDEHHRLMAVKQHLRQHLPEHMVPQSFGIVQNWPLTPSGKVDKKALAQVKVSSLHGEYVGAKTPTEHTMVKIWSQVLDLDESSISVAANFFSLGGHSLAAVRLVSLIGEHFGVELSVARVFDAVDLETLAQLVDGSHRDERRQVEPLSRVTDQFGLSFAQQRLWFIDQLHGASPQYNMAGAFGVAGELNLAGVNFAWRQIIRRHEVLRTVYRDTEHGAIQQINQQFEFALQQHDLSALKGDEQAQQLQALISNESNKPFDLSNDLMVRVSYFLLATDAASGAALSFDISSLVAEPTRAVLLFNIHHIACDGWSIEVMISEFTRFYSAFIDDQLVSVQAATVLPELVMQYVDYGHWQKHWLADGRLVSQLAYWQQQLADLPVLHHLSVDFPRPAVKQYQGGKVVGQLPLAVANGLQKLANRYQLTPFMLCHGALALMLSRHSNSGDIVIGTPVANRMQREFEPLVGFFVNTLVLRVNTSHSLLTDYLAHVRQVHLDAQSNQDVPFEQLVEHVNLPRSTSHTPAFQILLSMRNVSSEGSISLPGATLLPLAVDNVNAKFDLDIDIVISETGVELNWVYDVNLFKAAHVAQFSDHLCRLLTGLSSLTGGSTIDQPAVKNLPMLSQEEQYYLLHTVNHQQCHGSPVDYSQELCIHHLFTGQALVTPKATALVFEHQRVSYGELNDRANRLAQYLLAEHQVKAGTLVGVCLERSVEMVVALLAILKAGSAYVPLDPNYPKARLDYIIEDASLTVIVTESALLSRTSFSVESVCLDKLSLSAYPATTPQQVDTGVTSSHLAYVIYTSGSTGQPKGVAIEHRNAMAMLHWAKGAFSANELAKVLASTSINFDLSVFELFVPLCFGHQCVLVKDALVLLDPTERSQLDISLINTVPSAIEALLAQNAIPSGVKTINLAGEPLSRKIVNQLLSNTHCTKVCNLYGPSEDTTYSTCAEFTSVIDRAPDIGHVIANSQGYVLGDGMTLTPAGVIGQLYLAGAGVARGYLNQPQLTNERFIDNPFYDDSDINSSGRLYQTGDLVRYLPDGKLMFVGRMDAQVKVRGFRIELGEIEYQLSQHDQLDSAIVKALADATGATQLVAYIKPLAAVTRAQSDLIGQVKQQLIDNLPPHMVPGVFVVMPQWPLTPNGKIDKKALPAPDGTLCQGQYVKPKNKTEQQLARIWADLLKIDDDKISVTANFFELGGHSLLSVRLVGEIRRQFTQEMAIKTLFALPSIRQLAGLIDKGGNDPVRTEVKPLRRVSGDPLPLSFAQQRMWFIDQLEQGSSQYNMSQAFHVEGTFDPDVAEQALTALIGRHESLRTTFIKHDAGAMQVIAEAFDFSLTRFDLSDLAVAEQAARLVQLQVEDSERCFDLSADLMIRVSYIHHADGAVLLFNMHHIASDGWSMAVLMREFVVFYQAIIDGQEPPLAPLEIQYADYACWQKQWLEGNVLDSQLDYWQQQLADMPPLHSLILDKPRPQLKQHAGASLSGQLSAEVAGRLQQLARRYQLTPFMLLHGALALMLSRHSNVTDIVIGTPVANRMQSELEPLIGFFVNTLVLRVDTDFTDLSDYLTHVRQVHLAAQTHQDVPFDQLVERLNLPRSTAHTPVFQIMLTTNTDYGLLDGSTTDIRLPQAILTPLKPRSITAKFDLDIELSISDSAVKLDWVYDVNLFDPAHVAQFNQHLCCLLSSLAELDTEQKAEVVALGQLQMLSFIEQDRLINQLNDNRVDYPSDQCIHQLIEHQAAIRPHATAVVFAGKPLSYGELNHRANQLAHYLVAQQVKPDDLIGLCVERSFDMIIGVLGILKSGGAYVPLDPDYPEYRLRFMLDDTRLSLLLTQTALLDSMAQISQNQCQLVCLDQPLFDHYDQSNPDPTILSLTASHLAYVIYTSGSTGNPKGVMVEHRQISAFNDNMKARYQIGPDDKVLQFSTVNFDLFVEEYFGALCNGASLVLRDDSCMNGIKPLYQFCDKHDISVLNLPTAFWHQLMSAHIINAPTALRLVMVGGEALQRPMVERWFARAHAPALINIYGPTEATVTVIAFPMYQGQAIAGKIPIGQANRNVSVYICDRFGQLSPYGAVGELLIGGDCLSRGYLGLPELTAQRFIANPFMTHSDEQIRSDSRLYKSGDLVRYLANGQIEFVGRLDDQVKILGYRIEPGEIEYQLNRCDGVESALVLVKAGLGPHQQLVAYLRAESNLNGWAAEGNAAADAGRKGALIASVKQSLSKTLAPYMIPAMMMVVDEWPLTPNGKVDKKALPEPDVRLLQAEYVRPQGQSEQQLAQIWADLLQVDVDSISSTANFFELGGHSLLSVRLVSEIRRQFNRELSIKTIFECPTISALSGIIDDSVSESMRSVVTAVARDGEPLPLSYAQQRLWFIDQLEEGSSQYNMTQAFRVAGAFDVDVAEQAFSQIIRRHETLRSNFVSKEGTVAQVIAAHFDFTLKRIDVSAMSAAEQGQRVAQLQFDETHYNFDLTTDLMVRATFVQCTDEGVLLFNMHHIASDGWSMAVLMGEFVTLYQAISTGSEDPLPVLEIQYGDYAVWQRQWLQGEALDSQLDYWQRQLADISPLHGLLLDHPRPLVKQHLGGTVFGQLSPTVAVALQQLAKRYQLTPFMLLHSALALMLSRHSNASDIVIGTPMANRMQSELAPLIGFFVNTLILRVNTNYQRLEDYLGHVREVHLAAQSNQDVPFEQLLERLNLSRSRAYTPAFQILLTTNSDFGVKGGLNIDQQMASLALPNATLTALTSGSTNVKYDLDINIKISEDGVELEWVYDQSLFAQGHVLQFNDHLCRLLTGLAALMDLAGLDESMAGPTIANPAIKDLPMLSEAETEYLVHTVNPEPISYPKQWCIHQLFTQQALAKPTAAALVFGNKQVSYGELNQQANQLAHYLMVEHQIQVGTLVGICVERSVDMVVGLLAILKTGAAYVPLDPNYPKARLDYVVEEANLALVLSQTSVLSRVYFADVPNVCIDVQDVSDYSSSSPQSSQTGVTSDNLAYVIYTSGSTGKPKGVAITHRNASAMLHWAKTAFSTDELAKVLASTSLNFDLSVFELFAPLCFGHQCVLVKDALALLDTTTPWDISLINTVPSAIEALLAQNAIVPGVKTINLAGEPLSQKIVNQLLSDTDCTRVCNLYGPSEDTTYSTCAEFTSVIDRAPDIGKVINNSQGYVLGDGMTLTPAGVIGQLYLAGAGVAQGYLNQPQLTQERFIHNPFDDHNSRLYQTGDLVRYLPDGNLMFVGRIDAQVKVRGFRIELGEIEYQLSQNQQLDSAIVLTVADALGAAQLVAYIKPKADIDSEQSDFIEQVKQRLSEDLPPHMVPGVWVVMSQWPLTPNGKIDKKALPQPDGQILPGQYVAPQNHSEQQLALIWAALFNVDVARISATANFFDLGGHSLLSVRLMGEIGRQFGLTLAIKTIFESPTIKELACIIDAVDRQVDNAIEQAVHVEVTPVPRHGQPIPLSFAQQRLWFIDRLQGATPQYNMPIAFKVAGKLNLVAFKAALTMIIERHEVLRTVYVNAPTSSEHSGLQQVRTSFDFQLKQYDLSAIKDPQAQTAQWRVLIGNDAQQPFDLSTDLMVRASYILLQSVPQNNTEQGILLFNMHHIASDGWSLAILTEEFVHCYQAIVANSAHSLPPLAIQYGDYVHWQRQYLTEEVLASQLNYWQQQLADVPSLHTLILDYPRPEVQQNIGASLTSVLDTATAEALQQVAKHYQLTPFMLLHSALALVLSRHSNHHDIVIGTPMANRMQQALEPLIGFFVNTVVLRVNTQHGHLDSYLAHVREVHLAAQSNQDVPFEQLVDQLNLPRSTAHTPLFQIMLTTNTDYGFGGSQSLSLPGIELEPLVDEVVIAKFDLEINMAITEQGISLYWKYDVALFSHTHISQINTHLGILLQSLAALDLKVAQGKRTPMALTDLAMISPVEEQYLLKRAQGPEVDYPQACIHHLFERQVLANPTSIALINEQGNEQLSYVLLNHRANQLAHYLLERYPLKPGAVVALCVERSVTMVVAVLAILKTGAAYAPLEILHDRHLLRKRAQLIAPTLVLTDDASEAIFSGGETPLNTLNLSTTTLIDKLQQGNINNPITASIPQQLGYVLTTSGSTGEPKLIGMNHQPLVNLIYGMSDDCRAIGAKHRLLQFSSIGFDMSFDDISLALLQGGTLCLITAQQQFDVVALSDKILRQRCTLLNLPYAMLQTLANYANQAAIDYPDLIVVLSSAERLLVTPEVRSFFARHPGVTLVNHYGPSETNVCTAKVMPVEVNFWPTVPSIGRPLHNISCYVLTDDLQLAPQGALGTLYVGGDCLAQGYLGQPELTSEKFIANPFVTDASARLYNTGDLVRLDEYGDLEYKGRGDNQIKLRGFRIELGAIESALAASPHVKDNCVIFDEANQRLIAYISVAQSDMQVSQFSEYLKGELPAYMVPSVFMLLTEWPLNANGKVNKKALPAPRVNVAQDDYQAPETDSEKAVSQIWSQLLAVEAADISVNANFFALGGHSLLVIRLVALLNEHWGIDVSISAIYDIQTVLGQAILVDEALEKQAETGEAKIDRTILPATQTGRGLQAPLSFAQQRLWFIDQLAPGSSHYNMPLAFKVDGVLDAERVEQVLTAIIDRHELLRSTFSTHEGSGVQRIAATFTFTLKRVDLRALSVVEQQARAAQLRAEDNDHGFDLTTDLMVRASYIQLSDGVVLLFNMHHIASDGWSMAVLMNEFVSLYQAMSNGVNNPLPPLEIQYADYAYWQRQWLPGEVLDRQLDYWQKQLADMPPLHSLLIDKPRPQIKQHVGASLCGRLSTVVAEGLQQLARHHQLTPFMLLHSALALMLSRHSNSTDIVIGTPVANRMQSKLAPLIGFFVNTMLLRVDTEFTTLNDYLAHVRQVHLAAQSNQDVPFEQLVERLNLPRSSAHTPAFQIMLTTNTDYGVAGDTNGDITQAIIALPQATLTPLSPERINAKFDLDIDISLNDSGVIVNWIYDVELFESAHIQQFNDHLCCLLTALAESHNAESSKRTALASLAMLSATEQDYLVNRLNDNYHNDATNGCVHQLIEAQAKIRPEATAVVFEGKHLSYGELNTSANQLAHYIIAQQVKPDDLIGLFVERSFEMIVGVLAILKAGCAYVPLDPAYPKSRLQYMLNDANLSMVLTQSALLEPMQQMNLNQCQLVCLDLNLFDQYSQSNPDPQVLGLTPSHLAYVIYTSGSTGNPKGVMIEHRQLSGFNDNMNTRYQLGSDDNVLQFSTINFDIFVEEYFGALCSGATLVLRDDSCIGDINTFYQFCDKHDISVLSLATAFWHQLMSDQSARTPAMLRLVIVGGEALQQPMVEQWFAQDHAPALINTYGPTETTVTAIGFYMCQGETITSKIPIGQANRNVSLYICDKLGQLSPYGTVGELLIGGDCLARGYLGQPELTAQRFIANPFITHFDGQANSADNRLYKTGDLVRYLANGQIEFVGRIDDQVKILGYRIEPGEIEYQLSQCDGVESALVLVKAGFGGNKQLVAYICAEPNTSDSGTDRVDSGHRGKVALIADVKQALSKTLATYMIPAIMIVVDQWPLTHNGKIDKKALPEADAKLLQAEYVAPQTAIEHTLIAICAELLKLEVDSISMSANFFALGGHSLLVLQLLSQIETTFGIKLSVYQVFEHNTLGATSELIEKECRHEHLKITMQQTDNVERIEF